MRPWLETIWSSVGRKVISALTGLILFIFVIMHLLGNLALFKTDPGPFNRYSHFLNSLGGLLLFMEIALLISALFHAAVGTAVWIGKQKARPQNYYKSASAGSPSRKTLSSRSMLLTGIVLFVFIIIHVKTFKYGPGVAEGYVTTVNGTKMRDLYRLVVEVFSSKAYVIWYVAAMIFLGFHLRHGFWSAFQSLGMNHPRLTPLLYGLGLILAILLAGGFLILPIWIFFRGGGQ